MNGEEKLTMGGDTYTATSSDSVRSSLLPPYSPIARAGLSTTSSPIRINCSPHSIPRTIRPPTPSPRSKRPPAPSVDPPPFDASKMRPKPRPPPSYSSPFTKRRQPGPAQPAFEAAIPEAQDRNIFDACERLSNDSSPIRSYCDASHVGPTGGDHEPVIMYADESFADALSARTPLSPCAWSPSGTSAGGGGGSGVHHRYYSYSVASSPQASAASPSRQASPSCRPRPRDAPKDYYIEVSTREGDGTSSSIRALDGNINYVHPETVARVPAAVNCGGGDNGCGTLSTFSSTPNAGDRCCGEDISLLTGACNNATPPNHPPTTNFSRFSRSGLDELLMDPSVTHNNTCAPMTSSSDDFPRVGSTEYETSNARGRLNPPTFISLSDMVMASSSPPSSPFSSPSVVLPLTPVDWASAVSTSPTRGDELKKREREEESAEDAKAELLTRVSGSPPTSAKLTYSTEVLLNHRKHLIACEGIPIAWATGNREQVPRLGHRRQLDKSRSFRSRRSRSRGEERAHHRKGSFASGGSGASGGGTLNNNYHVASSKGEESRRFSIEEELGSREMHGRSERQDDIHKCFETKTYGSFDTEEVSALLRRVSAFSCESDFSGAILNDYEEKESAAAGGSLFFAPSLEKAGTQPLVDEDIRSIEKVPSPLVAEKKKAQKETREKREEQEAQKEALKAELAATNGNIAAIERKLSLLAASTPPSTSFHEQQKEPVIDEVKESVLKSVHNKDDESFKRVAPGAFITDNVYMVGGTFYSRSGRKCTVHEHSPRHRHRKQLDSVAAAADTAAADADQVSSRVALVDVSVLSDGRNLLHQQVETRERGGFRPAVQPRGGALQQRGGYANPRNNVRYGGYANTRTNMEKSAYVYRPVEAAVGKKEEECKERTTMNSVNSWNPASSSGSTARGYGVVNNTYSSNNGTSSQLRGIDETREETLTRNHGDWWSTSWKTTRSSGSTKPPSPPPPPPIPPSHYGTHATQNTVRSVKKGEEWTSATYNNSDWNEWKDWKTTTTKGHSSSSTKAREEKGGSQSKPTTNEWQDWKEGNTKEDRWKDWGTQWSSGGAWKEWKKDGKDDVATYTREKNNITASHAFSTGSSTTSKYDTPFTSNGEVKKNDTTTTNNDTTKTTVSSTIPRGEKKEAKQEKQEELPAHRHAEEPRNEKEKPRESGACSASPEQPPSQLVQEKPLVNVGGGLIIPNSEETQKKNSHQSSSHQPTYLIPDNQRHGSSGSDERTNDLIGKRRENSGVEPNPMVAPRRSSPFKNGDSKTFYLYEGCKYRCVAPFPEEGCQNNPEDMFLTLSPDDIVVFYLDRDDWAFGVCDGREGWFPPSFVVPN